MVDLCSDAETPTAHHARRHFPRLARSASLALLVAVASGAVDLLAPSITPNDLVAPLLSIAGAIFGTGLLASAQRARQRKLGHTDLRAVEARAVAALSAAVVAGAGWLLLCKDLLGELPPSALSTAAIWAGALALIAFIVLVDERRFAAVTVEELPEAPGLARLARLLLLALAAAAVSIIAQAKQAEWAGFAETAAAIILLLAGAEAVLRALAVLLLPLPAVARASLMADSIVASLLTLRPWRLPAAGSEALKARFGVDLSRSWALDYARRAAMPIAFVFAIIAWCMTALRLVPIDQRAVYERFGVPAAVLQPGLHVTLPWPLGRLRPVEFGSVHKFAIGYRSEQSEAEADASRRSEIVRAEDEPPPQEDRLWDARHFTEATFLIAGTQTGRQSFAVLQVDVSVLYRIGLDDADAMHVTYGIADPESLVRSTAGRLVERYFASVSLDDALSEDRDSIEHELLGQIRRALAELQTGIDVLAVVIEALHPPPEAATAYHGVQAAEITASINVATARSQAVTSLAKATSMALADRAKAAAAAADVVATAGVDALRFRADDLGYREGSYPFLLERYFAGLEKGLANAPLLLIDPALGGQATPLIDLRSQAAAGVMDTPLPPPAEQQDPNEAD